MRKLIIDGAAGGESKRRQLKTLSTKGTPAGTNPTADVLNIKTQQLIFIKFTIIQNNQLDKEVTQKRGVSGNDCMGYCIEV
jgi:hypothetical protein